MILRSIPVASAAREYQIRRSMKVASWNVNSVKVRRERLLSWIARHSPDVLCLQELKTEDAGFPFEDLYEVGYQAVVHGQRTYNGVGIVSKHGAEDVRRGFEDGVEDTEARMISARIDGVRVLSCYVPNGQETSSAKWPYKLARSLARLPRDPSPAERAPRRVRRLQHRARRSGLLRPGGLERQRALPPRGAREARTPPRLGPHRHLPPARAGRRQVLLVDYRMLAFPKGRGLRIDFVFATKAFAERCTSASIDREERKGKQPSDHAPVIAEFSWP
jgi:exodeoxyribonuclease-3